MADSTMPKHLGRIRARSSDHIVLVVRGVSLLL